MYDYSDRIESFRDEKVRLPKKLKDKLYNHRDANRDRLVSRLPKEIDGVRLSRSSFRPQGSMAVNTVIQTKFKYEEYDIDDGLVLSKDELVKDGKEISSNEIRELVLESSKDARFAKQPVLVTNAVRVFYKEDDEERHHMDIPIYRSYEDSSGVEVRELAGEDGWIESDPTRVNIWFQDLIKDRNSQTDGWGSQLRHLIQLLKRFCRSRNDWDMPSGMKLTMLVAECQPVYGERIDEVFRSLLENLQNRLSWNMVIKNLAHPDQPELTRTYADDNVQELRDRINDALDEIAKLDLQENDNEQTARKAWDWVFQSDGYFKEYDKQLRMAERVEIINSGKARTTGLGVISATEGLANIPHRFYGEEF